MDWLLAPASRLAWHCIRWPWPWGYASGVGALAAGPPLYRVCRARWRARAANRRARSSSKDPRGSHALAQFLIDDDTDEHSVQLRSSQSIKHVHISQVALSDTVIQCRAFCSSASGSGSKMPLTWRAVLNRWAHCDTALGAELRRAFCFCPFPDLFWECSPVSGCTLDAPFEFVMIDAAGSLNRWSASSRPFNKHLAIADSNGSLAAAFPNLGHDATLIAPTQEVRTAAHAYGHLASFVRGASVAQQDELWRVVSRETLAALQKDPETVLWLNTDGRGVPWLHVRLDEAPKYIKHRPCC